MRKVKQFESEIMNNFSSGPCGTGCRFPSLKLVGCTLCRQPHHHVCDGDTGELGVCKRCQEKSQSIFDFIRFINFSLSPGCCTFGKACIVPRSAVYSSTFQLCDSCGHSFHLACKTAVVGSLCEESNECGCIKSQEADINALSETNSESGGFVSFF